jgi:hypothetical protein
MEEQRLFMETTLELLTFDALFLILQKLSPKAILNLCLASENFERIYCQTQDVWRRLISYFFPNSFHTDNPRDQYRALAEGVITPYYILDDRFEFDTAYLDIDPEKEQDTVIEIPGLPLNDGTVIWVFHYYFKYIGGHSGETVEDFVPYKTREDVVKIALTNYNNFLSELEQYVEQIKEEDVNEDTLNEAAAEMDLPSPMTEERLKEWFGKNDSASLQWSEGLMSLRMVAEIVKVTLHDMPE